MEVLGGQRVDKDGGRWIGIEMGEHAATLFAGAKGVEGSKAA
ncbi:MAG: hypothetical protein V9E91_08150 [Burkholderiaceae bacterium]